MSGPIERFEDLIAWQKARKLTRDIYQITREGTFDELLTQTEELGRIIGGLRTSVERKRDEQGGKS